MKAKHDLCYCSSLPGSVCDFCSGLRLGTVDDYRSVAEWKRREKAGALIDAIFDGVFEKKEKKKGRL